LEGAKVRVFKRQLKTTLHLLSARTHELRADFQPLISGRRIPYLLSAHIRADSEIWVGR